MTADGARGLAGTARDALVSEPPPAKSAADLISGLYRAHAVGLTGQRGAGGHCDR
jgi:hypothetical protein